VRRWLLVGHQDSSEDHECVPAKIAMFVERHGFIAKPYTADYTAIDNLLR
jgi:hypothetical protein